MKKLFSTILVLAMTLGLCTPFAFAKTSSFPDVPSPQYDWAIDAIEAMLAEGYIKGYTDKTFKPANAVTKMESLIFAARLKGVLIADNKPFIDFATQLYADDLAAYSFGYKSEVSYLLYKGTITANELGSYLSADQINTPLKRYEAAKLLTNIMGGAATGTSVDFADSASIPKDYVPYVAYVVEKGLMNGVGANNFDPQGTVTRAQISVMLKRVIDAVALSIDVGTVTTVNRDTYTIHVTGTDGRDRAYPLDKTTPVYVNGIKMSLDNVLSGATVAIIFSGEEIVAAEALSPSYDQSVEGVVKEVNRNASPIKISVTVDGSVQEFPIAAGVTVVKDDKRASVSDIKPGMYVRLDISSGQVLMITAQDRDQTITGEISAVTVTPDLAITIKFDDGEEETYAVAADGVTVKRNGKTAELRDVQPGDKVTVVLRYNEVYQITATSTNEVVEGTIEELLISKNPYIVVKTSKGESLKFPFAFNMIVTVDGKEADLYALRVGAYVMLNIESNAVVKISTKAVSQSIQITGTIQSINTSYKFITVNATDAQTGQVKEYQVFFKTATKILDVASGKEKKIGDLVAGQTVTVVGAYNNAAFEAATVLVLAD